MEAMARSGGGEVNPIVAQIFDNGPAGRDIRRRLKEACADAGEPLTTQAIFAWKDLKSGIPPRRVDVVARVLNLRKSDIRPDLYEIDGEDDLALALAAMQAKLDALSERIGRRKIVTSVFRRKTPKQRIKERVRPKKSKRIR
jgi:hypothetical protein